jgi:hypothetical protein
MGDEVAALVDDSDVLRLTDSSARCSAAAMTARASARLIVSDMRAPSTESMRAVS